MVSGGTWKKIIHQFSSCDSHANVNYTLLFCGLLFCILYTFNQIFINFFRPIYLYLKLLVFYVLHPILTRNHQETNIPGNDHSLQCAQLMTSLARRRHGIHQANGCQCLRYEGTHHTLPVIRIIYCHSRVPQVYVMVFSYNYPSSRRLANHSYC